MAFFRPRERGVDYLGAAKAMETPLEGLMGGLQQGMQMAESVNEMRRRGIEEREKRALAMQQAQKEQQKQALALQATQDPEAFMTYAALYPEEAGKMEETFREQEKLAMEKRKIKAEQEAEEQRQQDEQIGRMGSSLLATPDNQIATELKSLHVQVKQEYKDPTDPLPQDIGLPEDVGDIDKMSMDELKAARDKIGHSFLQKSMTPLEYQELLVKQKKAGEPLVKVQVGAEKQPTIEELQAKQKEEFYKKYYGEKGKHIIDVVKAGRDAIGALDNADQLLAFKDARTGKLEPIKASIAATFRSLGMETVAKMIGDAPTAEKLESIANRGIFNLLILASGVQTEGDAQRARATMATLGDTPEAFRFKANLMKATAMRQIEMGQFFDDQMREHVDPDDLDNAWREYREGVPNISDRLMDPENPTAPMFYFQF